MIEIRKICCFQLHSFTLIWGWLGVIVSGIGFISSLITLGNIPKLITNLPHDERHGVTEYDLELFFGYLSFFMFLSILTSLGLISSVLKENHKHMLPWIFHEALSLIVEAFFMIIIFVNLVKMAFSQPGERKYVYQTGYGSYVTVVEKSPSFGLFVILLLKMVFNCLRTYIFIGIWSLFKQYRQGIIPHFQVLMNQPKV